MDKYKVKLKKVKDNTKFQAFSSVCPTFFNDSDSGSDSGVGVGVTGVDSGVGVNGVDSIIKIFL